MADETHRARSILYQQLMNVPHREYDPMVSAFREAIESDPDFTARACVHLATGGSAIRDQQDAGIITLLQADPNFQEYREAGRCLLLGNDVYTIEPNGIDGLPPYRIFRVLDYVRNSERKVPRLSESMFVDYLDMLEIDHDRADGVVVHNRRAIKRLWIHYHTNPKQYSYLNALLFGDPPEGSKLAAMKEIAASDNPREWLRLAQEYSLPYRILSSVLPNTTAGKIVLIESMSPTEALNARAWVERRGLLNIPEVRDVYVGKVEKASASVASAEHRASAKGEDVQVEGAIRRAKETAVKKAPKIEDTILLLGDKSASMDRGFPVVQQLGSRIMAACQGEFMAVLFNDYAQELKPDGDSLAAWQAAFKGQRSGGWTSMQAGFDYAIKHGLMPGKVVLVTDGGENRGSYISSLRSYQQQTGIVPHQVIIYVDGGHGVSRGWGNGLKRDFPVDDVEWTGDYYLYDQIVALLAGPRSQTLVEQILETQLPYRVGGTNGS